MIETVPESPGSHEPNRTEVANALTSHTDWQNNVSCSAINTLIRQEGWGGRVAAVLAVFAEDEERMAYLSGGRRPREIVTWLWQWIDSPFSIEDIRRIVGCGGWDPDPFVVLRDAGLLQTFLYLTDGSVRRVRGELAGGWLSDEFALAEDAEILAAVRAILEDRQAMEEM